MYRKLLVACDGSEGSQIAVLHASILAKKLGAELSALWVRGSLPHYPETIDGSTWKKNLRTNFSKTSRPSSNPLEPGRESRFGRRCGLVIRRSKS